MADKQSTNKPKKETFIVIMPVYNEEGCIEEVGRSWHNLVKGYPGSEILLVNDGSRDKTKEKLDKLASEYKEIKVLHKKNEGYGATVIRGFEMSLKSHHDWIFQTDSDNQESPDDFHKLWDSRSKSDFIIGYRHKRQDYMHRMILTNAIIVFNTILFGVFIKDSNVPYRLIRKPYLKKLLSVLPRNLYAPNIFFTILAVKDSKDIMHIPISHSRRKTGEVSIVKLKLIKVCMMGFKDLLLFRLRLASMMKNLKKYKQ